MNKTTILFQGDSITDGARGRDDDKNHILGHSYAYIAAATLGFSRPDIDLEFINKGVSGNTSADIYSRWQMDTLNYRPDIISILAGINDVGQAARSPKDCIFYRYPTNMRLMLKESLQINPDVKFMLIEPFYLDSGNFDKELLDFRTAYLERIQGDLKAIADEFDAVFVPLQKRFEAAQKTKPANYWIWDSVHPTYAGHGLIANAWLEAFDNLQIKTN